MEQIQQVARDLKQATQDLGRLTLGGLVGAAKQQLLQRWRWVGGAAASGSDALPLVVLHDHVEGAAASSSDALPLAVLHDHVEEFPMAVEHFNEQLGEMGCGDI